MNKVFFGDCRDSMRKLVAAGVKVQTCVTSPPYFGLRDYGTATWEGGSLDCDHSASRLKTRFDYELSDKQKSSKGTDVKAYGMLCPGCGANRVDKQIGLEQTPQEYVNNMVEVFGLVRELLADDGTCWINIGDSYAGSGKGRNADGSHQEGGKQGTNAGTVLGKIFKTETPDCKPKDLIGIPWMLAFALRDDGWYLRQEIIWSKRNCMPESVTDRCTKSHEQIFLLSKSPRYYFDHEAIKEPAKDWGSRDRRNDKKNGATGLKPHTGFESENYADLGRNKRSVWEVATQPYSGAHFATFPPALIEPCILAGSRPGDIVLDPFLGSGTTAQVSQDLGRQWIGCELNEGYAELQNDRTAQLGMAFA